MLIKQSIWYSLFNNLNLVPIKILFYVSIYDPVLFLFPSFSLPGVLCDPTDIIWRKGTPLEAMTGRKAPSSDGFLAEIFGIFLSHTANARRFVHSPRDHFIITLIIKDRRDWCDTPGKWPLARNPEKNWWHHRSPWTTENIIEQHLGEY